MINQQRRKKKKKYACETIVSFALTESKEETEKMDSKTSNDGIQTESKDTIEQILRFYECDDSIFLKMIVELPGSQEGDNYMSVVKRLIVSGHHDKNQNQNGKIFFLFFAFPFI